MKRNMLYSKEIQLATDIYDSSRSSIKFTLTPNHPDKWTVKGGMQLAFVRMSNFKQTKNQLSACRK